ncbi:MAG TPA: hypothetical protein VIC25_04990 [Caulobacteraceae bacterium]|jgi:hypothetical protein
MARKRAQPTHPLVAARRRAAERESARDPAQWGLDRTSLCLPVNADIDLNGAAGRARRSDVFERLLAGRADALNAVRRLQRDLSLMHSLAGGVARYAERIDVGPSRDSACDRRRRAAARVEAALERSGAVSARLLVTLCEPASLGRLVDWRSVVEASCGERLADSQAAAVRAACANLAAAYGVLDRRSTRQAAIARAGTSVA